MVLGEGAEGLPSVLALVDQHQIAEKSVPTRARRLFVGPDLTAVVGHGAIPITVDRIRPLIRDGEDSGVACFVALGAGMLPNVLQTDPSCIVPLTDGRSCELYHVIVPRPDHKS